MNTDSLSEDKTMHVASAFYLVSARTREPRVVGAVRTTGLHELEAKDGFCVVTVAGASSFNEDAAWFRLERRLRSDHIDFIELEKKTDPG